MQHSHMYLTAIIDWYSRMIVGWNLSDTLDTSYVIQAVKATMLRRTAMLCAAAKRLRRQTGAIWY